MAQVELKGVGKRWGDAVAVQSLDLVLEDGEFVAILGPSGCGKSTTLLLLAGIYSPSDGDIFFDDARINEVEPRDRNVGIVFQSYALYPNMTALQNIMFPLRFSDVDSGEARSRALEIAELVQVGNLLERRPSQLSGGQQQRIALARALVKRPNLLLLDEPLSNLDATLRLAMRAEIKRIQRELGVTTILVTHDQIEATTMADRIVCMNIGNIEQVGTAESLYREPATAFVASFVGSPPINLLRGSLNGSRFRVGEFSLPVDGESDLDEVLLGVRPEQVEPAESGIEATIQTVEPMGREVLYGVDTALGHIHFLEATQTPRFAAGQAILVRFDSDRAMFFDSDSGERISKLTLRRFE